MGYSKDNYKAYGIDLGYLKNWVGSLADLGDDYDDRFEALEEIIISKFPLLTVEPYGDFRYDDVNAIVYIMESVETSGGGKTHEDNTAPMIRVEGDTAKISHRALAELAAFKHEFGIGTHSSFYYWETIA